MKTAITHSKKIVNAKTVLVILSLVLSANIAFFLYNYFGWQEGFWSVVSIAAVITADLSNTVNKIIARLLGTLAGALYAYFSVHFFFHNPPILGALFAFGIFTASVITLQTTMLYYAGIVCNITMIVIIAASIESGNFYEMAVSRTFEVCLGILIAGIVSTCMAKLFVRVNSAQLLFTSVKEIGHSVKSLELRTSILVTALKVVLATAITFIPWLYFRYPGGFWATISCFFIIEESLRRAQQKGWLRFWANFGAASFGLISVLLIGGHTWFLNVPLTLGLIVCGYLLAQEKSYNTIGNTAGIALSIMLLADPGTQETLTVILSRFINVVCGIGVGIIICSLPLLKKQNFENS